MAAAREPINLTPAAATSAADRSPWHSPVPYLFGGLAAMLGLIAFALLILACSYWKLSGHLENGDNERDLEAGEETEDEKKGKKPYEEKVLVIMAGQLKPTFLATPVSNCSRTSSFGDSEKTCRCGEKLEGGKQGIGEEEEEEEEEQSGNRGSLGNDELPPSAAVEEVAVVVVAAAGDTTSHQ